MGWPRPAQIPPAFGGLQELFVPGVAISLNFSNSQICQVFSFSRFSRIFPNLGDILISRDCAKIFDLVALSRDFRISPADSGILQEYPGILEIPALFRESLGDSWKFQDIPRDSWKLQVFLEYPRNSWNTPRILGIPPGSWRYSQIPGDSTILYYSAQAQLGWK